MKSTKVSPKIHSPRNKVVTEKGVQQVDVKNVNYTQSYYQHVGKCTKPLVSVHNITNEEIAK